MHRFFFEVLYFFITKVFYIQKKTKLAIYIHQSLKFFINFTMQEVYYIFQCSAAFNSLILTWFSGIVFFWGQCFSILTSQSWQSFISSSIDVFITPQSFWKKFIETLSQGQWNGNLFLDITPMLASVYFARDQIPY